MSLDLRRAVVTGANRGLGLEFCRQLLAGGADVFATCREPNQAAALTELAAAYPDGALQVAALDVTDAKQAEACAASVAEDFGRVDALVHAAGVWEVGGRASVGPLRALDGPALEAVVRINAVGPLVVTRAFSPLLEPGAAVLCLSSGLGSFGRDAPRRNYGYGISKAALNMAVVHLADELAPREVRVVALDPGWVRTDLGGPRAPVTVEDAVAGLLEVTRGLGPAHHGGFFNRRGERVPW